MTTETKDIVEVIYWSISTIAIIITAIYVANSSVRAVKLGRILNDEQNKDNAKRNLFLTLYSYRGSPSHQNFVDALNRIDILFHDHKDVIQAWHHLYDSMQLPESEMETETHRKRWELLRVDLFDSMAHVLGYKNLKQTHMMKHYYSKGQEYRDISDWEFRDSAVGYWKVGSMVYKQILDNSGVADKPDDQKVIP